MPSRGPISWEEMGKEPRGGGSSPWAPLWWGCVGEAVLLTGYPACGPHIRRPVTARPPAGRGWGRGRYPLGEVQRITVRFPAFSYRQQTTSPARPSWWAGHEALVFEAAGQAQFDQLPSPIPPTREWGSKGKEPPSPWCSFPYFFKEIGPRPGRAPFPPVPTAMKAMKKPPTPLPGGHPPTLPPGRFFYWNSLRKS